MKVRFLRSKVILVAISVLVLAIPTLGQQQSSPSVADAARAAQAQKPNASGKAKVLTNDDLGAPAVPVADTAAPQATPTSATGTGTGQSGPAEGARPVAQVADTAEPGDCHNPAGNDAIQAELQAAQDELDQLRRDLALNTEVISGNNLDTSNFKPGGSGVDMGSPPLSQTRPQSPDRIKEVELQQRIASLKRAAVITCDIPENGAIQRQIDDAQKQVGLAQRELDLDSATYYSNPNYSQDTAGKAKINAEQEQVQTLQAEVDRLKQELEAAKAN